MLYNSLSKLLGIYISSYFTQPMKDFFEIIKAFELIASREDLCALLAHNEVGGRDGRQKWLQ